MKRLNIQTFITMRTSCYVKLQKFKQIFLPKLKMSLLLMVQLYLNLIVLLKNIKLDIM